MKIIIIGGVAAGMSAAAKASRLNKSAEIVIYEKTEIVSWGACGLPYYVGDFFKDPKNMIA
ncbi:MAG: CoA-disulfide reductase, partial [Cetobacterium sp.]